MSLARLDKETEPSEGILSQGDDEPLSITMELEEWSGNEEATTVNRVYKTARKFSTGC